MKYHITLVELAAAIGFSNQLLSRLELGEVPISKRQQNRIALAFLKLSEARIAELRALNQEIMQHREDLLIPMEVEQDEL